MIYITGDCHGNFKKFTRKSRRKMAFCFQEADYMIVCGDLGLCWERDAEFEYNCKWLAGLPFRILWVAGNHENYDMIAEYPCESWKGGKVRHIVRDRIILLERGQVFRIDGKTFFTFGGASSHDVEGGILDMASPTYDRDRRWAVRNQLPYRVIGKSWWKQELPSGEEIEEARKNLADRDYRVDYVVTHCASNRTQREVERYKKENGSFSRAFEQDILTDFLEELEDKLQFQRWFFGHYHEDAVIDPGHVLLYNDIVELGE